jgi:hypothetical protein
MFRPGGVWGGKQHGGHCTDLFLLLWRGLTGTTTRNPRIQTWKLDLWSTYNWNIFGHVLSRYCMLGFYRNGSASSMIIERPPKDTHTPLAKASKRLVDRLFDYRTNFIRIGFHRNIAQSRPFYDQGLAQIST